MPLLKAIYNPPLPFRNPHLATVIPNLLRITQDRAGTLKTIQTIDEDQFVIQENLIESDTLVCLLHGLEGSIYSTYIIGMRNALLKSGFSTVSINNRGCGPWQNMKPYSYHSGFIQDLTQVLELYKNHYKQIWTIGFSLGGSIALNQAIAEQKNPIISGVICVSVPLDLQGAALALENHENLIYKKRFLSTLKAKAIKKVTDFNLLDIKIQAIKGAKSIIDFDEVFTAPINHFENAIDYYKQCSTYKRLAQIKVPTLIINAANDTFLSTSCYPYDSAASCSNIHLLCPKHGGHVGFSRDIWLRKQFWHEVKAIEFIKTFTA